jgi:hypothetical protein
MNVVPRRGDHAIGIAGTMISQTRELFGLIGASCSDAAPTFALSTSAPSGVLAPILIATTAPRPIRQIRTSQMMLLTMLLAATALTGIVPHKNPFNN